MTGKVALLSERTNRSSCLWECTTLWDISDTRGLKSLGSQAGRRCRGVLQPHAPHAANGISQSFRTDQSENAAEQALLEPERTRRVAPPAPQDEAPNQRTRGTFFTPRRSRSHTSASQTSGRPNCSRHRGGSRAGRCTKRATAIILNLFLFLLCYSN